MKILFFCRRFYPLIGGVEKHVLMISKKLVEKGIKVVVVTEFDFRNSQFKNQKTCPEFVEGSKIGGIEIYRIPITSSEKLKKFQIWKWLFKNKCLIKEADIIHCHDLFYWFLPFKSIYPKKKIFSTFHGYEGSKPPKWNQILSHKLGNWLSSGSIAIGDWHEKWYGIKSDIVSYGAVEANLTTTPRGVKSLPPSRWKYNYCFVGRLAEDTGIMVYLKALKILKDKGKNYSLVVCGDGPQKKEAENYSSKFGLNVNFTGFINNVEKYLDDSEFIFVSRYLGILEALIAKKLIFAVYDSEIKKDYLEMSPFANWIVIEKDAVELADKIVYFADRPGKSKDKISKGFEWAEKQTWDKITNQYLSLWEKSKFR